MNLTASISSGKPPDLEAARSASPGKWSQPALHFPPGAMGGSCLKILPILTFSGCFHPWTRSFSLIGTGSTYSSDAHFREPLVRGSGCDIQRYWTLSHPNPFLFLPGFATTQAVRGRESQVSHILSSKRFSRLSAAQGILWASSRRKEPTRPTRRLTVSLLAP